MVRLWDAGVSPIEADASRIRHGKQSNITSRDVTGRIEGAARTQVDIPSASSVAPCRNSGFFSLPFETNHRGCRIDRWNPVGISCE